MLNIYEESLENPNAQVVSSTHKVVMEICTISMHSVGTSMLYNEEKQD